MMELTPELIRKHKKLIEAKVRVKGHTRHSKKGKAYRVQDYDREIGTTRANPLGKSGGLYAIGVPLEAEEFPGQMYARASSGEEAKKIVARHISKVRGATVSSSRFNVNFTPRDISAQDKIYGKDVPQEDRKFTGNAKKDRAIFHKGAAFYPDRDREINARPGGMKRKRYTSRGRIKGSSSEYERPKPKIAR